MLLHCNLDVFLKVASLWLLIQQVGIDYQREAIKVRNYK